MENNYNLLNDKDDQKKEDKDSENTILVNNSNENITNGHIPSPPTRGHYFSSLDYINTNYNDNIFIKFIVIFFLLSPLFSLLIRRNKIDRILSTRQIRRIENILLIILTCIFLISGSLLDSNHSSLIKFIAFMFLVIHLCVNNNAELIKGFKSTYASLNKKGNS